MTRVRAFVAERRVVGDFDFVVGEAVHQPRVVDDLVDVARFADARIITVGHLREVCFVFQTSDVCDFKNMKERDTFTVVLNILRTGLFKRRRAGDRVKQRRRRNARRGKRPRSVGEVLRLELVKNPPGSIATLAKLSKLSKLSK